MVLLEKERVAFLLLCFVSGLYEGSEPNSSE